MAPSVGSTGTVACPASSLGSGGSITVTLVVQVKAAAGTALSNTASVSANTYDPNAAINPATAVTSVKH
jgi:hypothetical protein